jgi:hypothetical protein
MNEECVNLLRRMELEDSDSDGETAKSEMLAEEEAFSLGDLIDGTKMDLTNVGQELGSLQEGMVQEKIVQPDVEPGMIQAKKRQKRHWGPALRVERPRRSQEEGRTVMQKAQDLKETRNTITSMTQETSFAFESNKALLNKAASVNISFGNDDKTVLEKLNKLKNKELHDRVSFENNNPEVNLRGNLDVEISVGDFPPLKGVCDDPVKDGAALNPKSWVDVASKSCENNLELVKNDWRILEH